MRLSSAVIVVAVLCFCNSIRGQSKLTYLDVVVQTQGEADRLSAALRARGDAVHQATDGSDRPIHLRVGPCRTATQVEQARAHLTVLGYRGAVPVDDDTTFAGTGVSSAPSSVLDARQQSEEAAALARLGLTASKPVPRTQVEMEAEALNSMRANTAREAAEAEKRRAAAKIAEEQAAAEQQQRELEQEQQQASAPAQVSTAASIINAISGGVSQGVDQIAAQNAQREAEIASRRAQIEQARQRRQVITQTVKEAAGSNTGNGLCPNGTHLDTAAKCDCRAYSANALYGCPSRSADGTNKPISSPVTASPAASSPAAAENHAILISPVPEYFPPTASKDDFVPGHDWCVHQTYASNSVGAGIPADDYLTFTNECVMKVRLVWFVGNGTLSLHDLEINETFSSTGITRRFGETKEVRFYACPMDHPHPADSSGNALTRPVVSYRCQRSGW
jgi:hypothetical protein